MSDVLLVVDDEPSIRFALRVVLEDNGFTVVDAKDGQQALSIVEQRSDVALVITDLAMPGMDGMTLLSTLQQRPTAPPTIMITAHGSERTAVEAMKLGVLDYFAKPFSEDELLRVVHRSLRTARLSREVSRLKAGSTLQRSMVFVSDAMYRIAELVERMAPREVSVLITGENGTGKELVAQALVAASPRANQPYLPFNCAALTPELAASELFGHARGSFTGANHARSGLFREAQDGTLLLDEVGELHPRIQGTLLRVLQERAVRPVGETRAIPVNTRILAATNRDLRTDPGFREDLYYRLNVVQIHLPPLRDRREDIVPLARHFAERAATRFGIDGVRLSVPVETRLATQSWPGNVRQLRNSVERMVLIAPGPVVGLDSLATAAAPVQNIQAKGTLKMRVDQFERGLIEHMLAECDGNQSETARRLQVGRVTLISKLKKYGLQ